MTHPAIIAQASEQTQQRLIGLDRVLLVQDTVSFNFSHHPGTEELGPLENAHTRGVLAHNTLAVSPDGGTYGHP